MEVKIIQIPEDVHRELKIKAAILGVPMAELAATYIKEGLKNGK